jgi:hypothetical protein
VYYTEVDDYLTREQKLAQVAAAETLRALPAQVIAPNDHGDCLNQRSSDFDDFLPSESIFTVHSGGLKTRHQAQSRVRRWTAVDPARPNLASCAKYSGRTNRRDVQGRSAPERLSAWRARRRR